MDSNNLLNSYNELIAHNFCKNSLENDLVSMVALSNFRSDNSCVITVLGTINAPNMLINEHTTTCAIEDDKFTTVYHIYGWNSPVFVNIWYLHLYLTQVL